MNKLRTFFITGFLSLTLFFTGCGQNTTHSTPKQTTTTTLTDVISGQNSNNSLSTGLFSKKEDIPRHEDGRAIVTLSVFHANQEIEAALVAFNQQNSEYYIELITAQDDMTYKDYIERELIEISAGKGPDLFTKTLQSDFCTYVDKGVIEDLSPYIERDLNKTDYLESSLYAYAKEGKVYAIESSFTLSLLAGSQDILGELEGWNLPQLLELMNENPEFHIFQNASTGVFLKNYLGYGSPDYTDYETLRECLAFDKAHSTELPSDVPAIPGQSVLVEHISIMNALDWADYEALYEQELTPVGYISTQQTGIFHNGTGWSINGASKQKEGAWAFLRFLLSEEYQREYIRGFSPRVDLLEEQLMFYSKPMTYSYFDESTDKEYTGTVGHTLVRTSNATEITQAFIEEHGTACIQIDCMSDKQLQTVRKLINSSYVPCFDWDVTAQNIIYEEAAYYFHGERSLDEVMNNIENRMNIYFSETE